MFKFIALLASVAIAVSSAAPTQQESIQCKPVGEPLKLFSTGYDNSTTFKIADAPVKGEKHPRLVPVDSTSDTFQRYNCTYPGGKLSRYHYDPNFSDDFYGQLRSTSKKDFCVTAGCSWTNNHPSAWVAAQHKTTCELYDKHCTPEVCAAKLEPCATQASDRLRRQWFDFFTFEEDGVPRMQLLGNELDEQAQVLPFTKSYAVFGPAMGKHWYSEAHPYLGKKEYEGFKHK